MLRAGHHSETVYILLSGRVKVCVTGEEDGGLAIAHCVPGAILGEIHALDGEGHTAHVIALEAVSVGCLSRSQFFQLVWTVPQLSINVMISMARRLRLATGHQHSLAADDIIGRAARQLLTLVNLHGEPLPDGDILIPLRLTQKELSAMIGASRTRVQQALAVFEKSGLIRTGRCPLTNQCFRIVVRNPAALKARCLPTENL